MQLPLEGLGLAVLGGKEGEMEKRKGGSGGGERDEGMVLKVRQSTFL